MCYQIRGGVWFRCSLSAADTKAAEEKGCEPVQHFVNGDTPAGQQTPEGPGLTKEECKLLYTRYPDAIKRDPGTGLLTLPLVPKGTKLQIKPEPDQKLSPATEILFDVLWIADKLMDEVFGKWEANG
jgi:hypothetical protein